MAETKQAVIVRFGEPQRVLNRYRPNEEFGQTGAGLAVRIPFVEQIVWIDKRIQSVEMENQQVLSTDQLRLQVDAFARYRIVDPLRMYISARTEDGVREQLRPILGSALRNELGRRPFAALLSPERGQMMDNIQNALESRRPPIWRARSSTSGSSAPTCPTARRSNSAYGRMRTAREQEARTIRAQGQQQAQIIRAEADAEAARDLCRRVQPGSRILRFLPGDAVLPDRPSSAPATAENPRGRSSIILSPNNDYLRQFRGNR